MTKHQTCPECRKDFVGPDTNIGYNNCPECHGEIHAECREELAELQRELEQACDRKNIDNNRLRTALQDLLTKSKRILVTNCECGLCEAWRAAQALLDGEGGT